MNQEDNKEEINKTKNHKNGVIKYKIFEKNFIKIGKYILNNYTISNYSQSQNQVLKSRSSIIDWLYIISLTLNDSTLTFFNSIQIFDLFLSKNELLIQSEEIQLYSAVCYFISKKFNEVIMLSIPFVSNKLLKGKFSKEEVSKTEINILRKLNFNINIDTVQSYSLCYYKILIEKFSEDADLIYETNTGINIFSLQVVDLLFECSPFSISFITYICSIKLIFFFEIIDSNKVKNLLLELKNILNEDVFNQLYSKYYESSCSLFEIIKIKKDWLKNKPYFKSFFQLVNSNKDNDENNENEESE